LRQRRWLELTKDYGLGINYRAGKANVVADAPSGQTHLNQINLRQFEVYLHNLDRKAMLIIDKGI
jgi:hypothetical protein